MKMSKELRKFIDQKDRRTWFYYHLKRDGDFKDEAEELRRELTAHTPHGDYLMIDESDIDYYLDKQEASNKKGLVYNFMKRWNIHWDYCLQFLLDEDEDNLPPMMKVGFGLSTNKEGNMFEVQMPITTTQLELKYLWEMMQLERERLGMDTTKKPHRKYNAKDSAKAFIMWKELRDGASWTKVLKKVEEQTGKHYDDISTAKKFLAANGYEP